MASPSTSQPVSESLPQQKESLFHLHSASSKLNQLSIAWLFLMQELLDLLKSCQPQDEHTVRYLKEIYMRLLTTLPADSPTCVCSMIGQANGILHSLAITSEMQEESEPI